MKKSRRKWSWLSCLGRRSKRYEVNDSTFECFYTRQRKTDVLESWPTSPVLHSEEKNTKEKEKAHKLYQKQLKLSSWYLQPPQRTWIEIVESNDDTDTCSQCYYEDACGCVLVRNRDDSITSPGGKSGSSFGDTLSVESGTRASAISKNSTEDEKSFYDNLCQFCKITTLERRARKYGEWRRRFSAKLAEVRTQDETESRVCTCAMDNLSFIEWKKIYEEEALIKLSRADHFHENSQAELYSNSDYSTQKSELHSDYGTQKSKDSTSTAANRDYPSLTVKSSSLGYNSLSSIPFTERGLDTESEYSSTDASDSDESGNEVGLRAGMTRMHPPLRVIRAARRYDDDEVFRGASLKQTIQSKRRRRPRYRNSLKTKAHLHNARPKIQREEIQNVGSSEFCSEGETITYSEGNQTCSDDIPNDTENLFKIPKENDETLPADFLSEFLTIARTIDEFYEGVHVKKFLENRIVDTSRERIDGTGSSRDNVAFSSSRDPVDVTSSTSGLDMTSLENVSDRTTTDNFSAELRKRIRSLERLCSFVEYSDEDESETAGSLLEDEKELGTASKEEPPVWRLSQQSINLTLSRRSRSGTGSDSASGRSRLTSTSGSGSSNSRSSTRQGHYKCTKPSVTSVENLKSPDSGFSDSLTGINSPEVYQLGTNWAGSMQWDYSDWQFYYGVPCHDEQLEMSKDRSGLRTIDETRPQDPLDWDW